VHNGIEENRKKKGENKKGRQTTAPQSLLLAGVLAPLFSPFLGVFVPVPAADPDLTNPASTASARKIEFGLSMRAAGVSNSAILPASTTRMRFESMMVLRRWAMVMLVERNTRRTEGKEAETKRRKEGQRRFGEREREENAHRAVGELLANDKLDFTVRLDVDRSRRFVENEDLALAEEGAL
jgi:hypothetical protein